MHSRRGILMATLALISLASEVSRSSPAAAASHYPLWVCPERYGGWGWSRPRDLFGGLTLDRIVSTRWAIHPHIGIGSTIICAFIMLFRAPIVSSFR